MRKDVGVSIASNRKLERQGSLLRHTTFMFLSLLVKLLTGVGIFIILARIWGAGTFGAFMFPYVATTLIAMVVDYGFGLQLVRDIGRAPDRLKEIVAQAALAKVALVVPLIIGCGIAIPLMPLENGFRSLFIVLLAASILNSFALFFSLPLRAIGNFKAETRAAVIGNALLFAMVGLLAFLREGPLAIGLAFLFARGAYVWIAWRRLTRSVGGLDWRGTTLRAALETLWRGFPYGVHLFLAGLYFQVDSLVIQHILGDHSLGLHQAGMRFLLAGLIMADVLTNVYLPKMTSKDLTTSERVYNMSQMMRIGTAVGCLGMVVLGVGASFIVPRVYGQDYQELIPLLPYFGIVLFIRYAGAAWALMLTVADRQALRVLAVLVALGVNLVLNFLLIPMHGLRGALFASLLTHVVLNFIYMGFVWGAVRDLGVSSRIFLLFGVAGIFAMLIFLSAPLSTMGLMAVLVSLVLIVATLKPNEWVTLQNKVALKVLPRQK